MEGLRRRRVLGSPWRAAYPGADLPRMAHRARPERGLDRRRAYRGAHPVDEDPSEHAGRRRFGHRHQQDHRARLRKDPRDAIQHTRDCCAFGRGRRLRPHRRVLRIARRVDGCGAHGVRGRGRAAPVRGRVRHFCIHAIVLRAGDRPFRPISHAWRIRLSLPAIGAGAAPARRGDGSLPRPRPGQAAPGVRLVRRTAGASQPHTERARRAPRVRINRCIGGAGLANFRRIHLRNTHSGGIGRGARLPWPSRASRRRPGANPPSQATK